MNVAPQSWTSWNRRISHPYQNFYYPTTELELAKTVAAAQEIRVVGTGRSSADICAGPASLISLESYGGPISIDSARMTVSAPAGILLSVLIQHLESHGYCLPALPDIDCITLGGAIATGTHGTGRQAYSLSDYLCGASLVSADGTIHTVCESSSTVPLDALRVSLGLLGMLATVTLRIVPLFELAVAERPSRDAEWLSVWPQLLAEHDFLRVLWLPHTGWGTLITGDKYRDIAPFLPKPAPDFHASRRSASTLFYTVCARLPALTPLANRILKALYFSTTVRKTGTLYQATVTKSRGSTMELAEWTIPFTRFATCFAELRRSMGRQGVYGHIPMDIRFIRQSSAWLANATESDTVTVGCVCRTPYFADRHKIFQRIEEIFLAHGGRPHWAKRFQAGVGDLDRLYPRLEEFRVLRRKLDPTGKFLNPWLRRIFE